MTEPLLAEILNWVNLAKGGPGSGAQPGHNFNGNQWGDSTYHRAMADAHESDAKAALSTREAVLSPENLHRDGEATPSQVARGRSLGAALKNEAAAHMTASAAHEKAADAFDKMSDEAGDAGGYLPDDNSPAASAASSRYAEANDDYIQSSTAAANASAAAMKASADAGKG